jgi:uncharacterized membrane protein YbhN (UPF0104 family)
MGATQRLTPEPSTGGGSRPGPLGRGIAARLRRALPWAIAAAILAYLFRVVPVADAWDAARQTRLEIFIPCTLASLILWFLIDSRALSYLFSRFNAPVSWLEARSLRGLTYLVTPINWNLGTATIILHLRRSKGIGAMESTSSMLFYMGIDLLVLGGLALAGVWMLPRSPELDQIGRGAAILVAVQIALLALVMPRVPDWGWLRRLRSLRIFRTHGLASWRDVALLLVIRALYFGGFVFYFWLGTRAFHVDLPLFVAVAATPVILIVGAIPITPAGLGTQQAAMLYLFSSYGSEGAILAFGLAFPVAVTLGRLVLGLLYIRDLAALRAVTGPEAEPPEEEGRP